MTDTLGTPATAPPDLIPESLITLREPYGLSAFRADLVAGLTVAVVALPLSMAIAIASGVSPDRGLVAAIVGGFLVSALGGSRYQVGGPAGAFIILVAATVMQHGVEGLVLATFLSGLMLGALGLLRLGAFVKYIPYPVTLGFTAGIGAIILLSQLRPFLGLDLGGPEPGPVLDKAPALAAALPTLNGWAVTIGVGTVAVIWGLRRLAPAVPGMLVAVATAAVAVAALGLPVETIGSVFGGLAPGLPAPALPSFDPALVRAVLPDAIAFTLLGAIESLLSGVVADSMTGRRLRPNAELLAQGAANVATALFGGMPVTGTIARTATNVRAGAHGPVAGMIHSVTLLGVLLLLAPLASAIPLAALAGVLVLVSLHMIDLRALRNLWEISRPETAIVGVTLALTVFRDLTEAILVGTALGAIYFLRRMSQLSTVDIREGAGQPQDEDTLVLALTGAYFFGSAPIIESVLERIATMPRHLVLDISAVPILDPTGAHSLAGFARRALAKGIAVTVAGASNVDERGLRAAGLPPEVRFAPDAAQAAARAAARPEG
jgi:sulfate permease, SulP family